MSVLKVLEQLGGVGRREQLLARGIRRAELAAALRRGVVLRPHRGCYALPTAPRSVVLARIFRASLACVTAAEAMDLPILERSERTHLVVENERSLARPGVRPMEEVRIHQSHTAQRGGPRVIPWVIIDQAGGCVSPMAQLVLVDAALNRHLMNVEDLDAFTVSPVATRVWLRMACDAKAESILETIARVRLRKAGMAVESQAHVPGVGRVDLVVNKRVAVELDGRAFHETADAFASDRRRDHQTQARGFAVARFTYADVVARPGFLESTVNALLARQQAAVS